MRLFDHGGATLLLLVGAGAVTIFGATVAALVFWLTRLKSEKNADGD
jgi:hypothetical protein